MIELTSIKSLNDILECSLTHNDNENKTFSSIISYNKNIIKGLSDYDIITRREVVNFLNKYKVIEITEDYNGTFSELLKKYNNDTSQKSFLIDIILIGGGSSPGFPEDPSLDPGYDDQYAPIYFSTEGRYTGECKMIKNFRINLDTPIKIKIGKGGASDENIFEDYVKKSEIYYNKTYSTLSYRPGTDTCFNQFCAVGGSEKNKNLIYHTQLVEKSDLDSYTGVGSKFLLPQLENNFNYLPHNLNKVCFCGSEIIKATKSTPGIRDSGIYELDTVIDDTTDYKYNFFSHPELWSEDIRKEYKELDQSNIYDYSAGKIGENRVISNDYYLANIFFEWQDREWRRYAFPKISGKDCPVLGGIGNIGLCISGVGGSTLNEYNSAQFQYYVYRSRIGAGGPGACYIYIH